MESPLNVDPPFPYSGTTRESPTDKHRLVGLTSSQPHDKMQPASGPLRSWPKDQRDCRFQSCGRDRRGRGSDRHFNFCSFAGPCLLPGAHSLALPYPPPPGVIKATAPPPDCVDSRAVQGVPTGVAAARSLSHGSSPCAGPRGSPPVHQGD